MRGYILADILGLEGKDLDESTMFGFTADSRGNIYFTIPVSFSVYRVSPEGHAERFGEPGSASGKFSVVSGVAVDDSFEIQFRADVGVPIAGKEFPSLRIGQQSGNFFL